MKPQLSDDLDEFDAKAEALFNEFQKTDNIELLLESAELYKKSNNPDGEKIFFLFHGLYHKRLGQKEKNNEKAIVEFQKSISYLLKVEEEDEKEIKKIELEIVSRKIRLIQKDKKVSKELFFESATLRQSIGDIKGYHADMALFYMYSIFGQEPFDTQTVEFAEKMVKEAELSAVDEFYYKALSLLHQIKADLAHNQKVTLQELEKSYSALQKTKDKYGIEELEAKILFARAMTTANKKKRTQLFLEAGKKWLASGNKERLADVAKFVAPIPINIMAILGIADETIKKQQELLVLVRSSTKSKNGLFPLFYHHGYLLERLKDFQLIMTRLGENRKRITELNFERNKYETKKFRRMLSKKEQALAKKQDELTKSMRLDLESLYIFGKILLDQWAFTMGYLIGYKTPEEFDFHRLSEIISGNKNKGLLQEVWNKHRKDIFWLFYQLKGYRNDFIEHVKKPLQKGTTMSVYGDEFNLFIPTASGWFSEDEIEIKLKSVRRFMPKVLKAMPDDYWEKTSLKRTLEVTFYRIDEIEKKVDREKVWNVWKDIGGSTLSYDKIGMRLINFMLASTITFTEIVQNNPDKINLGKR